MRVFFSNYFVRYLSFSNFIIGLLVANCDTDQIELWGDCYSLNVTNITRINEGLTGSIPSEIGLLTDLVTLKLPYNNLTGSIPPEIGNLGNLRKLELQYNKLSGELPSQLWNLTELNQLRLQKNQFTGFINSEIGNLTELTHLYLYGNKLAGNIPIEMGNLDKLVKLHLNNNQFIGFIPNEICSLDVSFFNPHLFDISGNQLAPPYPDCVDGFVEYQYNEYCESNYLFNGVCTEQSDLDVLQEFIDNSALTINMEMDENNDGIIEPIELGTQWWIDGRLTELNCNYDLANESALDDLGLSGPIPSSIGNLENLNFLWLEENYLNGPIPAEIGNLEELKYLILHFNELSGSIPSELGNLYNLEILKLDNNNLTGLIPETICNLEKIDFNWQNSLFGDDFGVYNNQLCPPYPDCVASYVGLQDTRSCASTSIKKDNIPTDFSLFTPYPNPFNLQTKIKFHTPIRSPITLIIFDVRGNEIQKLVNDVFEAGFHQIVWNADRLPTGIYFLKIESGRFTSTQKVSVLK